MTDSKTRQKDLLAILNYIQDGGDFANAKKMFQDKFDQVDVSEITTAERQLIGQGLDPRKIQYLCNVHADVFRGNIKKETANPEFEQAGHPVDTLKKENVVIKSLVSDFLLPNLSKWLETSDEDYLAKLAQGLNDLTSIDKHYKRKEISIFPLMTKYGITAPPQVMWGVDDKIRHLIEQAKIAVAAGQDQKEIQTTIGQVSHEVLEMIFKEEEIMLPMVAKVATAQDWQIVKDDEKAVGYTLIAPPMNWKAPKTEVSAGPVAIDNLASFFVNFKEGKLNLLQLKQILDLLPFALIFVDENDKVAYFGGGAQIFPHSRNALGNSVYSCHTQESRPKVEKIIASLKNGQKEISVCFQTPHSKRKLYFRYYRVSNPAGKYLGCLEVAQDITGFDKLGTK